MWVRYGDGEMMRIGDEKMEPARAGEVGGVDGQAPGEVELPVLGSLAREIIERQPLNPFRKLELKPIKAWDSMVELNG